jgi:hypothetical protein
VWDRSAIADHTSSVTRLASHGSLSTTIIPNIAPPPIALPVDHGHHHSHPSSTTSNNNTPQHLNDNTATPCHQPKQTGKVEAT